MSGCDCKSSHLSLKKVENPHVHVHQILVVVHVFPLFGEPRRLLSIPLPPSRPFGEPKKGLPSDTFFCVRTVALHFWCQICLEDGRKNQNCEKQLKKMITWCGFFCCQNCTEVEFRPLRITTLNLSAHAILSELVYFFVLASLSTPFIFSMLRLFEMASNTSAWLYMLCAKNWDKGCKTGSTTCSFQCSFAFGLARQQLNWWCLIYDVRSIRCISDFGHLPKVTADRYQGDCCEEIRGERQPVRLYDSLIVVLHFPLRQGCSCWCHLCQNRPRLTTLLHCSVSSKTDYDSELDCEQRHGQDKSCCLRPPARDSGLLDTIWYIYDTYQRSPKDAVWVLKSSYDKGRQRTTP